MYVTDIENGDWIKVRGVDFGTTGAVAFSAEIASDLQIGTSSGGTIEIRLDDEEGTLIGTVPVSYTGGADVWKSETIGIDEVTGTHDVYFVFKGGNSSDLFNFDHWQFIENTGQHDLLAVNASITNSKIDTVAGSNTSKIKVYGIYGDGVTEDITTDAAFTFNPENIISITDSLITGLSYGDVTATATFDGQQDSVKIVVKSIESEVTVSRIYSDLTEIGLFAGTTTRITIMAEFADGHEEDVTPNVTYSNPSPEIATIDNGVITGVSEGEVDIEISYEGQLGGVKTTTISVSVVAGISVWMEAECGEVGENWQILDDDLASNGKYVTVMAGTQSLDSAPATREGLIELDFNLDAGGDYALFARINAPTYDDDSFWVDMDNGGYTMFNGLVTDGWEWIRLTDYSLQQGDHTLKIGYREDGALLDKVVIQNYDEAPEGMGEEAINICSPTSAENGPEVPGSYQLDQNYPNPFNPATQIRYTIPESGLVKLEIMNTLGQKVATLVNERKNAGNYMIRFDASNLASGIYFYTLTAGDFTQTRKMLLIK
jgi:hypothetical protein